MLTKEQIEKARRYDDARLKYADELCDMALKYLQVQVQDQEPVGCVLPDGLVLINAFPHLPANTNLYAAPVPEQSSCPPIQQTIPPAYLEGKPLSIFEDR